MTDSSGMAVVTAGMAGANIYAGSMMLTAALEKKAEFLEYARTQAGSKAFRRKHRKDRRECADACGLSRSDRESGI